MIILLAKMHKPNQELYELTITLMGGYPANEQLLRGLI